MINTSIALLGVALQKDEKTPAAAPTFKHGLTGGGVIKPERSVEQKNVACGLRANASNGAYVSEVNLAVDFECTAYADTFGLYCLAALGKVSTTAVTGKDGYYKHVITLGAEIPCLTFWGQIGDTSEKTVQKATGCKVDELTLDFEGNAPLEVGVTAAGTDAQLFGAWSGSTEPSCFDGYFVPTGGTFLIDTGSQVPTAATVTKGGFDLSNSLEAKRGAGQVVATMLAEGRLTTKVNCTVIPDDWSLIRKVLTGTASGTAVAPNVVYGSAKWSFTHNQDPNCTLDVEFSNVPWSCETPEANPEGNAAEIEFSAEDVGIASKSGTPVTVTLVNKVKSYTA